MGRLIYPVGHCYPPREPLLPRPSALTLHTLSTALACLLLLGMGWQAVRVQQALLDTNASVHAGLERVTALQELQTTLLDVETGERGFVITGSPYYLVPYEQAREGLSAERERLALLMVERKGEAAAGLLARLDTLIERRLAIAETNIQVRESDGLEAASLRLMVAGGRQTMDLIRGLLLEQEAIERQRLATDSEQAAAQAARARQQSILGGLLVALLAVAAYAAIRHMMTLRRRLLEEAEHREARLETLLEAVPDDLYRIDVEQGVSRLGGGGEVPAALTATLQRQSAEPGSRQEFYWQESDDGPAFEVRVLATRDGEHLAIARDVTERRQVERMKAEFVSTVSHELRTPLTAIRSALGMLSQGMAGPLSDEVRSLVTVADKNGGRLARLIDDILDMEKLASGQLVMYPRPASLGDLVEQALLDNAPYAESFSVQLELVPPLPAEDRVRVDPDRFAQVMANLLSNAIKHSPSGGEVRVALTPRAHAGSEGIEVTVTDRGAGIPLTFQHRVFERFAQADSSDRRRTGGTGLGLAITRRLVTLMQGKIDFISVPDEGTRFRVWLPRAPSSDDSTQEETHE